MHLYSVAMGMSMAFMGRWIWQARALMPLYRKSRRRRPVPFHFRLELNHMQPEVTWDGTRCAER